METQEIDDADATVLGHIPAIRPGETVGYGEKIAVIDCVIVRKGDLLVRLRAHVDPVRAEHLKVPWVPVIWRKRRH